MGRYVHELGVVCACAMGRKIDQTYLRTRCSASGPS